MNINVIPPGAELPSPSANIVPRATIAKIVAHRNKALALYATAYDRMFVASDAINAAAAEARLASPGENKYNFHNHEAKSKPQIMGQELPDKPDYLETTRKLIDTDCWSYIVQISDLESVMDKKAKDDFRQELRDTVPEITEDNIRATLERFILEADTIFKRGIATCFTSLDRRFRSHDGWKIGGRVILTYAFSEYGGWNYNRNHDDTLMDIERIFLKLDGFGFHASSSIVHKVHQGRSYGSGPRQSEFENEFFVIRGFKNGNCHVWFKRDDLLERVNQLLGEYYDAPIPEERKPDKATGINDPKTSLAKNYGFFPTPDDAAKKVVSEVPLYAKKGEPPLTILEPSAGSGALAKLCAAWRDDYEWIDNKKIERRYRHKVDCVEFQTPLARKLEGMKLFRKIYNIDFLLLQPETTGFYDRVVMNPPFDRERDIDHVMHALKFLKPDGFLTAIMSAGTEFRETKKSVAFRALVESMKGTWYDLPPGSFASVGTNCNTIVLRLYNNKTRPSYVYNR